MTPYYQDDLVTLYHGNCLQLADLWTAEGDVLVTDPPYGMRFRSGWNGAFGDCRVEGDDSTETRDAAMALWGEGPALVFGRWSVPRPADTRMVLTWEKGGHAGMGDLSLPWKPNTEEIYVLGSGYTGRRTGSVLKYLARAGAGRFHPTEKPVDLMRELIGKCPNGVIVDPFAGSGTTLRASKDLGRRAIGVEIDENYCHVAANRLGQEVLFA